MKAVKIENLKVGDLFYRRDDPNGPLYVRDRFSRLGLRKGEVAFPAHKYYDSNYSTLIRRGTYVFVD